MHLLEGPPLLLESHFTTLPPVGHGEACLKDKVVINVELKCDPASQALQPAPACPAPAPRPSALTAPPLAAHVFNVSLALSVEETCTPQECGHPEGVRATRRLEGLFDAPHGLEAPQQVT